MRKIPNLKSFLDNRGGITFLHPVNFCQIFFWRTLQFFRKSRVSKNFMHKKGISRCSVWRFLFQYQKIHRWKLMCFRKFRVSKKFCGTKHRRVPLRKVSVLWDKKSSTENTDIPFLFMNFFDTTLFSETQKVYSTKFLSSVRQNFFGGKTWYPPPLLSIKLFDTRLFWYKEGFRYDDFRHYKTKTLQRILAISRPYA